MLIIILARVKKKSIDKALNKTIIDFCSKTINISGLV